MIEVIYNADGTTFQREIEAPEGVDKERYIYEIEELKSKLFATDYLVIKLAEGELTLEEYEPMKLQRKKWRETINKLEEEMNSGK